LIIGDPFFDPVWCFLRKMSTLESRRRAKELGPGKNREVDEAEGKRKGEPESTQVQTDQIANSKNNKKQQQQQHHHHHRHHPHPHPHPHPRRQYKGEQDKMRKALRRARGRRRRKRRKKQNTKTRSKQPSKQAGKQASKQASICNCHAGSSESSSACRAVPFILNTIHLLSLLTRWTGNPSLVLE
jgi:hypothetical protein